ncbi:hypothetical protein [Primorskyibacter sp. S187A]|uniref:hypothetical protein n=1 Tax=Primorskyibacter sp. S187A TaxID=3415130 RepID=UPI003C7CF924
MIRASLVVLSCVTALIASSLGAQEREVLLHAPDTLVETGVMKYVLPRFSLKTQVRVTLVPEAEAQMVLGAGGRPLMTGIGETWGVALLEETDDVARFADWLWSDVGQRTLFAFAPEGKPLFGPPAIVEQEVVEITFDGDADEGEQVSIVQCGRCHAVNEKGRMSDIGSTPSFFVLRAMGDWEQRFGAFYVLKPHAAFTQVIDITDPFPADRPSPIVPVEISLDDLENIMAYVGALTPADLGAPIQHQ